MLYVYGLVDPRKPDEVRYVGCTNNPKTRREGHRTKKVGRVYAWRRELAAEGIVPDLKVLQSFRLRADALLEENRLIETLPNLLNVNTGGGGRYGTYEDDGALTTVVVRLSADHFALLDRIISSGKATNRSEAARWLIDCSSDLAGDPRVIS